MRKSTKRKLRRSLWSLFSVAAAAVFYAGLQYLSPPAETPDGDLAIHFIDVGQGDSILLTCDGESALVDAGTPQCREDLLAYLQEQNMGKPRYIFATHPHADHIGSMAAVVDTFGCETFVMPDTVSYTRTFEEMLASLERQDCEATLGKAGDRFSLGSAQLELIWPDEDYRSEDPNEMSLVLQVSYGEYTFLLTGDAGRPAEKGYVPRVKPLTVLKAGHHGSDTSTTEALLQAAKPEYVIISAGAGNKYGHPDPEMLERVGDQSKVLRTDEQGTIVFSVKDGELHVNTER